MYLTSQTKTFQSFTTGVHRLPGENAQRAIHHGNHWRIRLKLRYCLTILDHFVTISGWIFLTPFVQIPEHTLFYRFWWNWIPVYHVPYTMQSAHPRWAYSGSESLLKGITLLFKIYQIYRISKEFSIIFKKSQKSQKSLKKSEK